MKRWLAFGVWVLGVAWSGCPGPQGEPGEPCTVADNGDGTATLSCPDGTEVIVDVAEGGGNVTEVDGSFQVLNAFDVQFMSTVRSVSGDLLIRVAGLTSVDFPALTAVEGSLIIEDTETLTTLTAANLGIVGADLIVRDNRALQDLAGLSALTRVVRDVRIEGNRDLDSVAFLAGIDSSGDNTLDDVIISGNESLLGLTGLGGLQDLRGNLVLENNDILSDLAALSDLENIDGDLRLIDNGGLTSCAGLNGLETIGNDLEIDNNDALFTLQGLGNLTTVGDDVVITNNRLLSSLGGLSSLNDVGGRLTVVNNDDLPECEADDLADDLGVNADISGNDPNC